MPRKGEKAYWNRGKKPGRPKKQGRPIQLRQKISQIYSLLPKDGSRINASEFKRNAGEKGIGFDTLYKYLQELLDLKFVLREFDASKYPPLVYYRRSVPFWLEGQHPLLTGRFGDLQLIEEALALFLHQLRERNEKKYYALTRKVEAEVKDGIDSELAATAYIWAKILERTSKIPDPARRLEFATIANQLYIEPIIQHFIDLSMVIGNIACSDDYSFVKRVSKYLTDRNLRRKDRLIKKLYWILDKKGWTQRERHRKSLLKQSRSTEEVRDRW